MEEMCSNIWYFFNEILTSENSKCRNKVSFILPLNRENTYTQRNDWLKKKCVSDNGLRWYMSNIFCFILMYMAENGNSLRSGNHPYFYT